MKYLGLAWGLGGVLALLVYAIWRLAPLAFELADLPLDPSHWAALIFSVVYMSYAEGYKGFHLGFAPRLVARAQYLGRNPNLGFVLFAPLFCMGFVHATARRKLASIGLTVMIAGFIMVVRQLPQPWRGILDAGVVAGLSIGICSILYFIWLAGLARKKIDIAVDAPADGEG